MSKNKFTPLEDLPKEEDLKSIVSNLEFKKVQNVELPDPIKNIGLVNKCNSFIGAASGSQDGMLYSFVGIRPDKGNVVDEHPFVFYYDYNDPSKNFGGIIHHGEWDGRTVPLEPGQIASMSASGLTAEFTYKSIPPNSSGSLEELRDSGILDGLSTQFDVLLKNRPKK